MVLRFKDYAAWTSLVAAAKDWSITVVEALEWILYPAATDEAALMFSGGDEYNVQHSYFPYSPSLGLVRRGYFSATASPNLYTVIHCAGCLRQSTRSVNAQVMKESSYGNAMAAAWLAHTVLAQLTDIDVKCVQRRGRGGCRTRECSEEDDGTFLGQRAVDSARMRILRPTKRDSTLWVEWWNRRRRIPDRHMMEQAEAAKRSISNPRPNSHGLACNIHTFA